MHSINHDDNEPPPSEDEDRSLLFGPAKEGAERAGNRQKTQRRPAGASSPPGTSPPTAEAAADPAGRTGPAASSDVASPDVASSDAVQRRILALLEDLEKQVTGRARGETDLAAAARIIAGQAEQIGAATEWVNDC